MLRSSTSLSRRFFTSRIHQCSRLQSYRCPINVVSLSLRLPRNVSTKSCNGVVGQVQELGGPCRRYTTSSTIPTTISDPQRPSLYYHFSTAPNPLSDTMPAYAVSFLNKAPKDPYSPAILGWLIAASSDAEQEAGIGDFKENENFLKALHEVVRSSLDANDDERLVSEAIQLGQGWMHVNDDRKLPEMGRINSPDDIIGSVRVEEGQILTGTYNPMPAYRICTTDGLTTLSKGLHQKLLQYLQNFEEL